MGLSDAIVNRKVKKAQKAQDKSTLETKVKTRFYKLAAENLPEDFVEQIENGFQSFEAYPTRSTSRRVYGPNYKLERFYKLVAENLPEDFVEQIENGFQSFEAYPTRSTSKRVYGPNYKLEQYFEHLKNSPPASIEEILQNAAEDHLFKYPTEFDKRIAGIGLNNLYVTTGILPKEYARPYQPENSDPCEIISQGLDITLRWNESNLNNSFSEWLKLTKETKTAIEADLANSDNFVPWIRKYNKALGACMNTIKDAIIEGEKKFESKHKNILQEQKEQLEDAKFEYETLSGINSIQEPASGASKIEINEYNLRLRDPERDEKGYKVDYQQKCQTIRETAEDKFYDAKAEKADMINAVSQQAWQSFYAWFENQPSAGLNDLAKSVQQKINYWADMGDIIENRLREFEESVSQWEGEFLAKYPKAHKY